MVDHSAYHLLEFGQEIGLCYPYGYSKLILIDPEFIEYVDILGFPFFSSIALPYHECRSSRAIAATGGILYIHINGSLAEFCQGFK